MFHISVSSPPNFCKKIKACYNKLIKQIGVCLLQKKYMFKGQDTLIEIIKTFEK